MCIYIIYTFCIYYVHIYMAHYVRECSLFVCLVILRVSLSLWRLVRRFDSTFRRGFPQSQDKTSLINSLKYFIKICISFLFNDFCKTTKQTVQRSSWGQYCYLYSLYSFLLLFQRIILSFLLSLSLIFFFFLSFLLFCPFSSFFLAFISKKYTHYVENIGLSLLLFPSSQCHLFRSQHVPHQRKMVVFSGETPMVLTITQWQLGETVSPKGGVGGA